MEDWEEWEYWTGKLSEIIEEILETSEVDGETGELILAGPWNSDTAISEERFQTFDDVKNFLYRIGFIETNVGYELRAEGLGISLDSIEVDYLLEESNLKSLFIDLDLPDSENRIFTFRDYSDQPLIIEAKTELSVVNEELILYLSKHPNLLYNLDSRKFEELIAEIFRDLGFEIILTPRTRDGGNDIRAVRKDALGTFLYLIECKRYGPKRPVGVEIIRSLYGVAMAEQATFGIVATTSYFTKSAEEFARKVKYHISLRDFNDLRSWIENYGTH